MTNNFDSDPEPSPLDELANAVEGSGYPAKGVGESHFTCSNCGYNLSGSVIGGQCPECGTLITASLRTQARRPSLPKLGFTTPILATLFCCTIGGIVALVYTSSANSAQTMGEYNKAKKGRDTWLMISYITLPVVVIIQLIIAAMEQGL